MKAAWLGTFLALASVEQAFGWGQEGHSIIAEIAERRLDAETLRKVRVLLGGEVSMASIASWADDYRALHPETGGMAFRQYSIGQDSL
jgi:nuclease S1